MAMAKSFPQKVLVVSLLLVVIVGMVIVVVTNREHNGDQKTGYGASLRIDKAVIVDIPSNNCIVVEIKNETENEKDEYSLSNGDVVSAVFSEGKQRAIDFIGKLHVGSVVNISRYDNTKPQNATPYITLECTGIDIYDDKGEEIVEFF